MEGSFFFVRPSLEVNIHENSGLFYTMYRAYSFYILCPPVTITNSPPPFLATKKKWTIHNFLPPHPYTLPEIWPTIGAEYSGCG